MMWRPAFIPFWGYTSGQGCDFGWRFQMKKKNFRLAFLIPALLLITILGILILKSANGIDLFPSGPDILSETYSDDPYPPHGRAQSPANLNKVYPPPWKAQPTVDLTEVYPPPGRTRFPVIEASPPPTPTAIPEPEALLDTSHVIKGWGDFPRVPVIAPGKDGSTLALYFVEGDQATQLLIFENTHIVRAYADILVELSPDRQYIAYLVRHSYKGDTSVGVVDVTGSHHVVLSTGNSPRPTDPEDILVKITSMAWMGDGRLLFTKVTTTGYVKGEVTPPSQIRHEV
jgi:hypothetical protein